MARAGFGLDADRWRVVDVLQKHVDQSEQGLGRLLFVGDRRQSIYSFAGADPRSMERIGERTEAERLPLSIW